MISTKNGIFILFLVLRYTKNPCDNNDDFSLQTRVIKCKFLTLIYSIEIWDFVQKFVHLLWLFDDGNLEFLGGKIEIKL